MRTDHVTTTPEAAAQFEADNTAPDNERPDASLVVPESGDGCEWEDLIHDSALRADRLLRGLSWRRA